MTDQLALDAPSDVAFRETPADWLHVPASMAGALRDYQSAHIEQAGDAVRRGVRRVLMQAPTGSGKTTEIVAICKAATDAGLRALILATRTRVVRQISERLASFQLAHGVLAAALPQHRWHAAAVQVASVDTLYRRAVLDERMPLPPAELVVFDEAHLAAGDSRVAILDRYPHATHIGLTATPAKISGRPLSELFEELIPGPKVRELIASGHLVAPRLFSSPLVADDELASIRKDSKTADYAVGELGAVMSRPRLVGDVLANWRRIANDKRTLVFACNKQHGAALLEDFLCDGIAAELLTDQTPEDEREAAIARLERGDTLVLLSCTILSYGTDIPSVECIVLARPTRSAVLYLQAVGRGLRPSPGKAHCIVIDHGRIIESLGMPTADFDWSLDASKNVNRAAREATTRGRCSAAERPRTCPECSHVWLISEDGPGCRVCGWVPAPRARVVSATTADLQEIEAADSQAANADRFYCEALGFYQQRWPDRWAEKEKSARWWGWLQVRESLKLTREKPPSWYWTAEPLPCTPEVHGKLKSRLIAYAKRQHA
jgi:superfamily II DNA or RNA helicase